MGLRERVALVLVSVIITQISITQCLPIEPKKAPVNRYLDTFMKAKGIKSVIPAKCSQTSIYSNGKTSDTKDAALKKSMYKAYNFPEMEYMSTAYKNPFYTEENANTYEPIVKDIGNPQTKAVDDLKKQLRSKRKLNRVINVNHNLKRKPQQFPNMPQVHDEDTFQEVQFPINAMETWAPKYWPTTFTEKEQQNDLPEFPMFNSKATEFCKQKPFNRRSKSKIQHFMEEVDKLKEKMNRPTIKNITEESNTTVNTCDKAGDLMKSASNSTKLPTSQETNPVIPIPSLAKNNSCPYELNTTKNENIEETEGLVGNPEVQDNGANKSLDSYFPELAEIPEMNIDNNATEKENTKEILTNNVTEKCKDQNSEKKDTASVSQDPMNIPLPLVKDIANGNEPYNNVSNNKAPYKSIIIVPVGDSVREIQIPVADTNTDSPIILIIPATSRTDNNMLPKLLNISCVTEIVSNTPVYNISNEASQAGTILSDAMTNLPVMVKEYILENSNVSSTDLLVLDFEKLPNNSMCNEIRDSPKQTTLDGIPPNEKPAISSPDILPSNVQNMEQASSVNNLTDVSSSNDNVSEKNNSLLDKNEPNNDSPITQSDSSDILSPSVIADENTNYENGPTHSDEENTSQSNTANDTPLLVENTPAPDMDEQSLPFKNENDNDQQSNNLDSDLDADRDIKTVPEFEKEKEKEDNTTSTSEDALTDETLSDQEDVDNIKNSPITPISSKLNDNLVNDDSPVDSPLPSNVVESEKTTYECIKNVKYPPPDNEEPSCEASPKICQATTKPGIPSSQISDTTPSIDQASTPVTDIKEPQTKEPPIIDPTEDNNEVITPNTDDPKNNTDIFLPANDPISDVTPIDLTDNIMEDHGVAPDETDINDSKLPDETLVDDKYTILPIETFAPDILTDNTELLHPDSQSPLPGAIESSDPSLLDEKKTATLPNGIESNDLLPVEEVMPDEKEMEDSISPEVPQVTDGLDVPSDDVPTSVAESPTLPTDNDLSSAELTNLIKYLYANV